MIYAFILWLYAALVSLQRSMTSQSLVSDCCSTALIAFQEVTVPIKKNLNIKHKFNGAG